MNTALFFTKFYVYLIDTNKYQSGWLYFFSEKKDILHFQFMT